MQAVLQYAVTTVQGTKAGCSGTAWGDCGDCGDEE
jgi:hypothetical protein